MSLFGRNVQGVTANSTTTNESTVAAPLGTFSQVKGGKTGTIGTPAHSPNSHFGNTSAGARANVDVLMYANDTPSAFVNGMAVGVFGVTRGQMQNNISNSSKDRPAHAGWVIRKAGTGPVVSAVAATPGNNFANGETITVSNAQVNAQLVITTNATGNLVTLTVNGGGYGFTNTSMLAISFDRELHVANITGTAATTAYNNADIITVSNATGMITNAVWHIATNTSGGIVNAGMVASNAINLGLFANSQTNAGLTFTVTNATGGSAAGNSSTGGLASVLITSQGGTVTITLGGRAGRTMTETLIAAGTVGSQTAGDGVAVTVANGLASGTTSQLYYPGS